MLERAAFFAHRDILAYLLDLGANPNDRPDGGSSALEVCIRHLGWEDFDRVRYGYRANYQTPGYKVSKGREAIKLLLQRGAMWKPDPSTLNDVRRVLYRIESDVTVELIGLLLKNADGESVRELLRVPRMRQHVAASERQLARLGLALDGRRRSGVPATRPPSPYVLAQYDVRVHCAGRERRELVLLQGRWHPAAVQRRLTDLTRFYTALWERKRLDLRVEAMILRPEWQELFSDVERRIEVNRLREYGYSGSLPDVATALGEQRR